MVRAGLDSKEQAAPMVEAVFSPAVFMCHSLAQGMRQRGSQKLL